MNTFYELNFSLTCLITFDTWGFPVLCIPWVSATCLKCSYLHCKFLRRWYHHNLDMKYRWTCFICLNHQKYRCFWMFCWIDFTFQFLFNFIHFRYQIRLIFEWGLSFDWFMLQIFRNLWCFFFFGVFPR